MKPWTTLLFVTLLAAPAFAAIDTFEFDTPTQEARFHKLAQELRCLVCQNQSLADSNAELALDLRRQVYEMVKRGQSDSEIVDYMVARYGDFVLYRPPVKPATYPLWFGPVALFGLGILVLWLFVRRRVATASEADKALSEEEQQRLDALLGPNEKERRP